MSFFIVIHTIRGESAGVRLWDTVVRRMGSGSQSGSQESLFCSNGHCVLRIKWAMYQKKKNIPESFGILNSKFNKYSCCRLQLSLTLITCGFSSVGKNGVGKARDSVTPHSLHCLCLYIGKAWAEQWMDSSVSCGENDLILQTKNGTCELEETVKLFISSGCFPDTVLSCWVFCISETVIAWNFLCTQQKTHHLSFRRLVHCDNFVTAD